MKDSFVSALFIGALALCPGDAARCNGQTPIPWQAAAPPEAGAPVSGSAQEAIDLAKRQVVGDPKNAKAWKDLAAADLRMARQTVNSVYLRAAEDALGHAASLDPGNFEVQKTHVALQLAEHRWADAKTNAALLNTRVPDDVIVYGYVAEADIALGDYAGAEKSTQWMLNLRRNNVPGLLLGARLRELYGDPEGALQFLNLAFTETSPVDTEELAWIANQIAAVLIDSGKADAAEAVLDRAEQVFPHYTYTTESLARVRMAQHRYADAVGLFSQAVKIDSDPHQAYLLAQAESAAGRVRDAAAAYADFVKAATAPSITGSGGERADLVLYYAASPATYARALSVAQSEIKARQDVTTLDAYAWALYVNGRFPEADAQIQKAMAVGIQSAEIFNHAGHIAEKLGRGADAAKYFGLSLQADPASEFASESRQMMGASQSAAIAAPAAIALPAVASPAVVASATASPLAALVGPRAASSTQFGAAATVPAPAAIAGFASVPPALLTPRATDTSRLIRNAQAKVAGSPQDAVAYANLGAAYFQRARETGDVNDYQLAEQALTKSLDLDSANFTAAGPLETMAEVCMGEHRFDDALAYSQKALALGSGDISPFATIGDAYADKGEYDQAALAYARLAPAGVPAAAVSGYVRDSRVAYLKFITGDTDGAVRLIRSAAEEGVEAQIPSENLAWLYYELGEFLTQAGDVTAADAAYITSLTVHPGDYRALAGLARLRGNQGRYSDAITLYQKAIAVVPMPIFVAELGDLYAKSGDAVDAKKQFQLVEYIGLLGHINQVLHNRDLALFYADHDIKLDEALELAHREFEVRHDIYTWDALAWALYKNGKYDEAAKASAEATKLGTRDPLLVFHAGMIADKLGRLDQARNELKEALIINPHFHAIYADEAQQRLTLLETGLESGLATGASLSANGGPDAK